jgi:hypothetical protein
MWRARFSSVIPAFFPVIPAKAGIHNHYLYASRYGVWVPAFAGTT